MPGKRKRDEDESHSQIEEGQSHSHSATVFVSNLPYTATSTDIKTLFSDVAPVKNAFVVLEKETKVSKGVGYVTFAMKEDAEACVEKQTVEMNGRMLRIEWAGMKPKPGEVSPLKKFKPPKKATGITQPQKLRDPNAIRTIVITGLPTGIDSKVLWKKVRKYEGADVVTYPCIKSDGSEDASTAEVLFTTPAQAVHAIERLNAHVFKGSILGVTLKKRAEKRPNRSSRLIVRNLPWDTTESQLRALFLPHGSVYSVEFPRDEANEEGKKAKAKGFAFVWMLSRPDAEKAINGVNGKVIKERTIAVDWALSKSKWEGVKEQVEADAEADMHNAIEERSSGHSESGSESDNDSTDEGLGIHSDGDISMRSASEDEYEDDRGSPSKPELPPPEAGTTLFARNVPWEATEDELRQLFRAFGPLRYVRIVMDHDSGRSKGTAFMCYWKKEDADQVIAISETLSKETSLNKPITNPFRTSSLLTPDPSSHLARNLAIHGRTLDVVRAVTRETAGKLRDEGVKLREKADKRNLYLMREGVIFPNSPAASTIPPAELEKRMNAFNARRNVIRTNPSLYVSKTRLSIRQLPTFVSERSLKRLAHHAIKEFDKEVEGGERDGLEEDELDYEDEKKVVDVLSGGEVLLSKQVNVAGRDNEKQNRKGDKRGSKKGNTVKQAKIVRLSERVDPLTGKGKSKGYGFLETEKHADALKVLRWANNNPETGVLFKQWYKEEMKEALGTLQQKGGKLSEEDTTRLKRLKEVTSSGDDSIERGAKKTLVVEFSIENAMIVKKREGREIQPTGTIHPPNKSNAIRSEVDKPPTGERRSKNRVMEHHRGDRNEVTEASHVPKRRKIEKEETGDIPLSDRIGKVKPTNTLGSLIGRKRKMRKLKGGGR